MGFRWPWVFIHSRSISLVVATLCNSLLSRDENGWRLWKQNSTLVLPPKKMEPPDHQNHTLNLRVGTRTRTIQCWEGKSSPAQCIRFVPKVGSTSQYTTCAVGMSCAERPAFISNGFGFSINEPQHGHLGPICCKCL